MTKKPFHSMSEDFDELEIEPVRMREPDIPDDWLEAETGEASKPRDKSAGEIHMSWLNENSHSKPRELISIVMGKDTPFIEKSAYDALKAENERLKKEEESQNKASHRHCKNWMQALGERDQLRGEAEKLAEALNKYIYPPEDPGSSLAIEAINQWKEFTDGK